IIFLQAQFADFVGKAGIYRLLTDFMSPPGAPPWHLERFCFIATALSASTGVTAQDKVDRLEARTPFRAPEPDAQPEAVAGSEAAVVGVSGARQAGVLRSLVESLKLRARPLVASVEPAGTAAVRLWFRATVVSAAALEPALVSAAMVQVAVDR